MSSALASKSAFDCAFIPPSDYKLKNDSITLYVDQYDKSKTFLEFIL